MLKLIQYEIIHDHIAIVTLYRPEAANAMSKQLLDELNETVEKIDQNPNVFCTIITGSTNKVFCAGADLKERQGMSNDEVISAVKHIGNTVTNVANLSMPTIAAINGIALGGGLELALACDIRLAADHANMGLTETSLAIIPGAGGTQRLPRLIGLGKAKQLIYTGERISAEKALTIGLVEQLTSNETLQNEAVNLAATIAQNGPIALRQAKVAIDQGTEVDLTTGLTIEHLSYQETIPTDDRLEGLQAFKEKRKPVYQGK